jgi:4-amino-4-deoxy-L-arabinose transferase-like glycosyltransferase
VRKLTKKFWPLFVFLLAFAVWLFHLLKLPVFADEAIYIRWSQLIMDDWKRYLFYPMNDGKTPLLMWLMLPFQYLFQDQLFAGRFVSVLAGGVALFFIMKIAKIFDQSEKASKVAAFLLIFLPYSFFYIRLAVTDALLFAMLSMSYYFLLRFLQARKIAFFMGFALSFFLAIFSKTPALLAIPAFFVAPLFFEKSLQPKNLIRSRSFWKNLFFLGLGFFLSGLLFYSFRFVPLFSQLFGVGSGFLYPLKTLMSIEIFSIFWRNLRFFAEQAFYYLTPGLLFFLIPFGKRFRKEQLLLLLSAFLFLIPLLLLGRVIYSRYFLPSVLFFILSASLGYLSFPKKVLRLIISFFIVIPLAYFIFTSYFAIDSLPLSKNDRSQYLEEWSAGQGIKESVNYIEELAKTQRVSVATEGSFGTLPDGILLYLHGKNVDNIYVEGIGQPIYQIPEVFWEKAAGSDTILLIVNSHRLKADTQQWQLLQEYCRPNQAACLQVWQLPLPKTL